MFKINSIMQIKKKLQQKAQKVYDLLSISRVFMSYDDNNYVAEICHHTWKFHLFKIVLGKQSRI